MQLDGRFGALSAVLEILIQDDNDTLAVLPRLPHSWKHLSFDGISAPGGFLIGATVADGTITEVRITSLYGNPIALRIGSNNIQHLQPPVNQCIRIQPAQ
jgi:alpha-L-fucosidase 2